MSLEFNWFIPSDGDGRHLINTADPLLKAKAKGNRAPTLDYLVQVARAAEVAGFHAALMPTGSSCKDPWTLAAALSEATERLRFLVAFRPGFENPLWAANKAASLQDISKNRLLLNVVTGGSAQEQKSFGDFLSHDARYARTADFLRVVRTKSIPSLYFGGASAAAEEVAAELCDVYLLWGETPAMVSERVSKVQALAAEKGRRLRFGIRLHVITRDTQEEAWAEAERLWKELPDDTVTDTQKILGAQESVGQARMLGLHGGKKGQHVRDLEVSPNLWAGVGLARSGAGTALVGSHQQVIARIEEYASFGIDTFIFSGYPNLEEALRVGRGILPHFKARQL